MKPRAGLQAHDAARISWEGTHGTGEASDLAPVGGLLGRVWDDAADLGFWLENRAAGTRVLFVLSGTDEREGELQAWHLTSHPDMKLRVTILND